MDAVCMPYWLSEEHRTELSAAIDLACATESLHPVHECHLLDVGTELRVATARDRVWPTKAAIVRRAVGYADDVLPVRMNDHEVSALLALSGLTDSVRDLLSEGLGAP